MASVAESWRTDGYEALARGDWAGAIEAFDDHRDEPEALEGIGTAAWWLDDADQTVECRERAYRLYRARADALGAARVACALAWDSVLFGGRPAVAGGWLDRARSLLADVEPAPEHGWLGVREAELALHVGDVDEAIAAARRATEMGERIGRVDVVVVASALEGLAMVNAGEVAPGMARLDGAAVAATSGEVDDLMWIGKVCCFLIGACERANDFDRAVQWCEEVQAFCKRWELQTLFSVCRTQYATVLLHQGTWDAAETELTRALAHFDDSRRLIVGEGVAQLGRLRLRQGRFDEAALLFAQAPRNPVSRLGRASLLLERGDAAGAADLVESMLRETPTTTPLARRGVLEHAVRIGLAAGNVELAERSALELRAGAETIASPSFRGAAALSAGMLAEHRGDLETARVDYDRAAHCYHDGGQPYEEAHARLRLARVLEAAGLRARARDEARAALDCFRRLGADRDRDAAERFLDSVVGRPSAGGPLTRRETDVLGLVASGRTNKQIAEQLVISEHTVHRHVANILRKLDEPTRAAAAAHAARLGFI